ncbi:MAG: lysine 2,3-aminomutase [Cyanobacteria bacterium P01_F01_bin.150]
MLLQHQTPKCKYYGVHDIQRLPQLAKFSDVERLAMKAVAHVLPFRTNSYVIEELIDWDNVPDDPIFRLIFPHPDMLVSKDRNQVMALLKRNAPTQDIKAVANTIRRKLNPHPAGQKDYNVPMLNGLPVQGVQHKYRETALLFPTAGQTCHSYCTYCFRWPQFVGMDNLKFATRESGRFQDYLRQHKEITDVLLTGGDPMTMKSWQLDLYIAPLFQPEFDHIRTIRIGTKSLAYWPYRFVSDPDADATLSLFERVIQSGKHLAIMAHVSHYRELSTPIAQTAIRRVRSTGAEIRCQAPLIRHVNDSVDALRETWQTEVELGCIPYYMFVERQTGAQHYFELPLAQAFKLYREAVQHLSGLARTVRGPVMSCLPGKVSIDGVVTVRGEKVFVLSFLQSRDQNWYKVSFFAKFDPEANWFTDLSPAFGEEHFFFEQSLNEILQAIRLAHQASELPVMA